RGAGLGGRAPREPRRGEYLAHGGALRCAEHRSHEPVELRRVRDGGGRQQDRRRLPVLARERERRLHRRGVDPDRRQSGLLQLGSCVKAYAPGSDIKSTWLAGMTMTMSGTSMAAPHVTGVAALYKATLGDAPSATVSNWIISNATTGAITGNAAGTPHLPLCTPTVCGGST